MRELKICLIDPLINGVYKPKEAVVIDYITVPIYEPTEANGWIFLKALVSHVQLLLTRNGHLPED